MTRAQRRHRRLIQLLCDLNDIHHPVGNFREPVCFADWCFETKNLEIDHPNGRKVSNRDPKHRRKSFAARVREYWDAFADGVPLRVLCRSCNARDGGGRRIGR